MAPMSVRWQSPLSAREKTIWPERWRMPLVYRLGSDLKATLGSGIRRRPLSSAWLVFSQALNHLFPAVVAVAVAGLLAGLVAVAPPAAASTDPGTATIAAVAGENQYANVISQIGGRYVSVTAIMSNPNTDPHEFEASARVAVQVSQARLVVQNGLGYDSFMDNIEAAGHRADRKIIVVQHLLRLGNGTFNPHLWYDPRTMPLVATDVASDLSELRPARRGYFEANVRRFDRSLRRWQKALATFKAAHPGTPVAVTEPVADYMLEAAGARIMTPRSLQSAVMNGTDPSPQDISTEQDLISGHRVKAFLYNEQVTDGLTGTFLSDAKKAGVPVIAVYETMPPGYDYQTWMLGEVTALDRAVTKAMSTVRL
jgi:zinc/manganese transport system substrate-binding protein